MRGGKEASSTRRITNDHRAPAHLARSADGGETEVPNEGDETIEMEPGRTSDGKTVLGLGQRRLRPPCLTPNEKRGASNRDDILPDDLRKRS